MRISSSCVVLFLLSLLTAGSLSAQPVRVSYVIPDIGAPGMNTYVEIIAPQDATGEFGRDTIYANNPSDDVRVVATGANAADVIVGPIVVSWNGRLISTHVFVKPGVAANRTVQLVVRRTGRTDSSPLDFTIVTPTPVVSGAGGVLGEGSLGRRSLRGAMIVDSLVLTGGTYTVSKSDPNGNPSDGNQGYLPFVLISKGPVRLANAVKIDVNGSGRDGAAGGGGGGGQVCDGNLSGNGSTGTEGGDGFTSGGGGGRNGSRFPQPVGEGSGTSGRSLNGVAAALGSAECTNPEGAGGGTGHPFGLGGDNACQGFSGKFGGGGSGHQDGGLTGIGSGGGGGGYGLDGSNGSGNTTGETRGRQHGNGQLVPLAGGSGGAGGNPRGLSACAGFGGGGGGAIAIYSMDRIAIQGTGSVTANGAAGGTPSSGQRGGGGGSGGGIILGAKINTSAGGTGHTANAGNGTSNGGNGSIGRTRFDGFVVSAPSFTPANGYVGPSTDTLTYATSSTFTLTGTRGGTSNIRVYMRGDNTDWQLLGAPTYSGRTWSLNVTTPGAGNNYFAAFQEVSNPNNGQYTAEPSWVTSQVAANIVKVVAAPRMEIVGIPIGNFANADHCPDVPAVQTVIVFTNTGTADLHVSGSISGVNQTFFSVTSPTQLMTGGITVEPGDTAFVVMTANPPNTGGGPWTATLTLNTDDTRPGFSRVDVPLQVTRTQYVDVSMNDSIIDFGQVCVDQSKLDTVWVRFKGYHDQYTFTFIDRPVSPSPFSVTSPSATFSFMPSVPNRSFADSVPVIVRFAPQTPGVFYDTIRLRHDCDRYTGEFVVYLRGEGVQIDLEIEPGNIVLYGPVPVNSPSDKTITIRNNGTEPVTIKSGIISQLKGWYTIIDPPSINGLTIPPNDSLVVTIRFVPDTVGPTLDGQLQIELEGPCNIIDPIYLRGNGVIRCLQLNPLEFSLTADSCSINPQSIDTTLTLQNCGGLNVQVVEAFSVNNKLSINLPGGIPRVISTNRNVAATVTWDPLSAGSGIDTIVIVWRDTTGIGDPDTLRIPVTLKFDRAIVELQTVDGDVVPPVLDLGGVYQCSPAQDTVVIVNAGTVEGEITGGFLIPDLYTVDPPLPFHLDVGESKMLVISLDPSQATNVGTTYVDTLVLQNGKCDQEWRIGVKATRYELTFDVQDIDFGGTNLGLPRTQTVEFVNTTNAPPTEEIVIESVYVDPPTASPPFEIVDPTVIPARVQADSGRLGMQISFTPTAEQEYNGRLCFHLVEPCDTVICIDMTGEGIRSNIYVPQGDLNFGDVYYCTDSTLSLTIYSVGPVPLQVNDIQIAPGGDAAGFSIVSISKALPNSMRPGFPTILDSIVVLVRFTPMNVPPDGLKSATLQIFSNDSAQGLLEIPLTGNRVSPSIVGPTLVDYGTVVVSRTGTQQVTLTNTSRDTIRIVNPQVNPPFRIASPLPLVIPPGESILVDVEFTPDNSQIYNDTLIGTFTLPCDGEVRVPLTGEGLRGTTVVSIPSTVTGEPRERISIPIILEEAESIAQVGATTFRARIRFNASMLLPLDVQFIGSGKRTASSGGIISSGLDGADRVIEVEIANDPLPAAPDTLGWVDAVVLLGNSITTPISFDTLYWTDGEVATTTRDGQFDLSGYCDVGNNRLIKVEGAFGIKAVTPNPVESQTEIEFETVENGATTLEVYDVHGRIVATLLDVDDLPVQAHIVPWNAADQAAGVYYAVLTTPTQRSIRRLVLVK